MIYTFDLTNKTVIITGGYGYLGKSIVESLAFHNAEVYVLARDENKFIEAFNNSKIHFVECDISNSESCKIAFESVFKKTGKIDVLINNAFYSKGQSPEEMTNEDWDFGIDGSLSSVFRAIRDIIPYMKQNSEGKIINVSSMYGIVSPQFEIYENSPEYLNPPHYGAAKAGVIQLTKYYASYLGKYNINVNSVVPGPFPSENVQNNENFINELKKKTVLNRIGKPEDLGGVFVLLSSEASNFITGQSFVVDGGWTIK
jgi:NAD(P)-dependent dehydrogenase (short-subunit alcohol dehydrogenase family)